MQEFLNISNLAKLVSINLYQVRFIPRALCRHFMIFRKKRNYYKNKIDLGCMVKLYKNIKDGFKNLYVKFKLFLQIVHNWKITRVKLGIELTQMNTSCVLKKSEFCIAASKALKRPRYDVCKENHYNKTCNYTYAFINQKLLIQVINPH